MKNNLTKTEEEILKEFEALYVRREIPKGANTWNTGESQLKFLRQALRQQREEILREVMEKVEKIDKAEELKVGVNGIVPADVLMKIERDTKYFREGWKACRFQAIEAIKKLE